MSVYTLLNKVQTELVASKNQFNAFGKYAYRSCEDILEGVKPHLKAHKCVIVISDSIEMVGDRIYVKATAKFIDCESGDAVECTAYAREALNKKGMDEGQITGATSSYSRKYALNALLLCDDSKDADTMDNSKNETPAQKKQPAQQKKYEDDPNKDWLSDITQLVGFSRTHNLSPEEAVAQGRKKYKISKAKAEEIKEAMQ
jgi:hypothetical protein